MEKKRAGNQDNLCPFARTIKETVPKNIVHSNMLALLNISSRKGENDVTHTHHQIVRPEN